MNIMKVCSMTNFFLTMTNLREFTHTERSAIVAEILLKE